MRIGSLDLGHTANFYEWGYLISGLLGLVLCIVAARRWTEKKRWVRDDKTELTPEERAANLVFTHGSRGDAILLAFVEGVIFLVGAYAVVTPPTNPGAPVTPLGVAIQLVVASVAWVLVYLAWRGLGRDGRIIRALYGPEAHRHTAGDIFSVHLHKQHDWDDGQDGKE